ncbi:MAG: hypothetical protein IKX79_02440 [Desulfovibrionaceae bacterium]|nr:hypothetical protein [Desulfovibrionaceae bacterium]
MSNLVCTTPASSMHALAWQGIAVSDCYAQIRAMLQRHPRLGDRYVLLFAEPVRNNENNSIDWYTPVQGLVRPLLSLTEDEQAAMRSSLANMASELRSYAEELRIQPEPSRSMRGHILDLALRFPDESCLYAVGGQPVFTCWGFGPGTPGADPQDLCRIAPAMPRNESPRPPVHEEMQEADPIPPAAPQEREVPPPPVQPGNRRRGGWLWLLPLLLLLLLAALAVTSFGGLPTLSGHTIFNAPLLWSGDEAEQAAALREKNAALRGSLASLTERLKRHAQLCRTNTAIAPAPPIPPKQESQKPELSIPENPSDLAFLKGRWRCETDLMNARTGAPVTLEFLFDAKGEAVTRILERGDICRGTARAELSAEGVHFALDEQRCTSGNTYPSQSIDCTRQGYSAFCRGTNADGTPWDTNGKGKPVRFIHLP